MVRNAKTSYRTKQLQNTTTKTVWKTIQYHNTHHQSIPLLEGHTEFKAKCASLHAVLFPATNHLPRLPIPTNFLNTKKDLRHHTYGVTTLEVQLAISRLRYGTSVDPDGISYKTLRHLHEAEPTLCQNPDFRTPVAQQAT
jgi:hypothetical protein